MNVSNTGKALSDEAKSTHPSNPAADPRLIAAHEYVALSNINVTDHREFTESDEAALVKFGEKYDLPLARSVETTHALIRVQTEAPFLFISSITDRVGHFEQDVSYNVGIVLGQILLRLESSSGKHNC